MVGETRVSTVNLHLCSCPRVDEELYPSRITQTGEFFGQHPPPLLSNVMPCGQRRARAVSTLSQLDHQRLKTTLQRIHVLYKVRQLFIIQKVWYSINKHSWLTGLLWYGRLYSSLVRVQIPLNAFGLQLCPCSRVGYYLHPSRTTRTREFVG